jgi:hypothetical protein
VTISLLSDTDNRIPYLKFLSVSDIRSVHIVGYLHMHNELCQGWDPLKSKHDIYNLFNSLEIVFLGI